MGSQCSGIAMKIREHVIVCLSVVTLSFSFVMTGCSVATQDNVTPAGPLKLTLPQQECLEKSMPYIQQFFQGTVSEENLNDAWNCTSDALTMFTTSVRGSNPDYYTSRELRTFLETFFLGDIKVSDQLLIEAMRLKQILIGGAADRITRPELAQAQNIIAALRIETQRLRPFVRLISMNETVDEALKDPARVEAGLQALQTATATLGGLFSGGTEQYDTDHLEVMLKELKPVFKNWNGPEKAINYLPTFGVIKTLLLNPAGNRIAPNEWQPLLTNAGRIYALYLRGHYLMAKQELMLGAGLKQLMLAYEEAASILRSGIEAKPAKMIKFTQLDDAVNEIYRLDLVNSNVRDTTVKTLIRVLFQKILNPATKGVRPSVKGLTLTAFDHIYSQGASFLEMQRAWESVIAKASETDSRYRTSPIPLSTVRQIWPQLTTGYPLAQEDLKRLFNIDSPITYRENDTVIFDSRISQHALSQRAFNSYNWKSLATRMILNGYSTDATKNRYSGVTQTQLQTFFNDVHDLGVDLEILEPKDDQLWKTSFGESNMFMVSSENDGLLSYFEGFDFFSYTLGAGVMSMRVYNDIKGVCPHLGADPFGRPAMDMPCYRKRNQEMFAKAFAELPTWVKVYNDLGPAQFSQLQEGLEKGTRGSVSEEPITTSDLTRVTMIMEYIESIYVRYDVNRSGTIEYPEAQKAFPLFKELLQEASGFKDDRKLFALFSYLLTYGKPPTSISEKVYWQLVWLSSEDKWKQVHADRMKILGIVGALSTKK